MADDVIIVGSLKDTELRKTIEDLVKFVGKKTDTMAESFTQGLDKMKLAMKDFAISQKVGVDLMQEAWRKMSKSFDAMVAAESAATGRGGTTGGGAGGSAYAPNTVGALEESIKAEQRKRKEMELTDAALQSQNDKIARQKDLLDSVTRDSAKKFDLMFNRKYGEAMKIDTGNLAEAERKLNRLKDLAHFLNVQGITAGEKVEKVNSAIARTERAIARLKEKSPKTLKDVLGMDESSIEAVARKLRELKRVQIDPKNTEQVNALSKAYRELKEQQAKLMGQSIQQTHANNYLAQSFGYIRNRVVYALTLGAITSFTKQIYEIRGQYELLERSLGILVNSFERGSLMFQQLNQMAIESPFTLMELAGAAKQLTAYNFAAKEVVDTTRRLADISAALGVPMERLTYNLGQIRAQTVLTARDARDFANAGLPIVSALADRYSDLEGRIVTTGEVYDRMSKKMVSYSDVMAVLNSMTDEGGKFFQFQARQAETLRVQMANLTLAWNNMLNEVGKSNQGLLVAPIKGLKLLLQNWSTLDRIIKSLVLSFGVLKVVQIASISAGNALNKNLVSTSKQVVRLRTLMRGLFSTLKSLAFNPFNWLFAIGAVVFDLVGQANQAKKAVAELNEEIKKGADEASRSNLEFLSNRGNKATLKLARENQLSAEQGEKAWETIREQIEQSAMSSSSLIAKLLQIDDINERVRVGFNYVEQIQKSQAALQDLRDDTIKITSDSWLWGAFGEGLVSDLKDFKEELGGIGGKMSMFTKEGMVNADLGIGFKEYRDEIEVTAQSIKNFLDAYNIKDPLQIKEILERVKAQIKAKNPEIKGELAALFDVTLDQRISFLTKGAVNDNESLWNMFIERLRNNYSSAFSDITSEWVKSNENLTSLQNKAVLDNLAYFKSTMPYYYDTIAAMVNDASQLKVRIGVEFNVKQLTDFQEEVQNRIKEKGIVNFTANDLLPSDNDLLPSYVDKLQKAIKSAREENKNYERDDSEYSKRQIRDNNIKIQQAETILDLFNQPYEKEKKSGNKQQKDLLGDALAKEIQYITDIQKRFKDYQKMGVDAQTALTLATDEYGKSIIRNNVILQKYGFKTLSSEQLANMPLQNIRDFYKEQINGAGASTKGVEALEKAIANLNVEITKIDYKKITDGLNNELGKLKEEYELAVELDANPEMGNLFAEMFDIDTNSLPQNIDELAKLTVEAFNRSFEKQKKGFRLETMFLTDDDLKAYKEESEKEIGAIAQADYEAIEKSTKAIRGMREKQAQDTLKKTQELEYKLADTNGKIAIEEKKLSELQIKYQKETNDGKKKLLELHIQDQKNAIDKLKEEVLQLLPTYKNLFNSIVDHSAVVTRKIAEQWEKALESAVKNPDGTFTITDPHSGEKATISERQYGKELDRVNGKLRETQNNFAKIKEAFTKGEDGIVDWVQGLNLVAEEAQKAAQGLREIANIADELGASEEDTETINDIANSLEGLSTAAQGIGQFASGDYIGGTINAIKGTWQAISTWFDNKNKHIDRQIEQSKFKVQELELAYKKLEYAASKALGTEETQARRESVAVKEQELLELERQLALEQQKDYKKSSDRREQEERIQGYLDSIESLRQEIQDAKEDIVNNLFGEDVKSAAEAFVDTWVQAWQAGETTLDAVEEKMNDMIVNLIKKAMTSKIVEKLLTPLYKELDRMTDVNSAGGEELTVYELRQLAQDAGITAQEINTALGEFYGNLESLGVSIKGGEGTKELSALQQGIQGITEDTAGALESYMNIVSQRIFEQNQYLLEIRDHVASLEFDVQLGTLSQMLLQLQQSYTVQLAIQGILDGVLNPSGRAFVVELNS